MAIGKHVGKEVGKALVGEVIGILSRELTDFIQDKIVNLVKSSFEQELKEKIFQDYEISNLRTETN
jgi:hypothetical protein